MNGTTIILLVIIGLLLAYGGYVTYLLWFKQKMISSYEDWIDIYARKTLFIKSMMQQIDISGAFQNDDEVGKVFDELNTLVGELGFSEIDKEIFNDLMKQQKQE